jgi:hypothetical protein
MNGGILPQVKGEVEMTNLRVLRGTALSAGVAAGLFGLVAFAPSAFAQYNDSPYWNGAPNATGPFGGSGYGYYNNGPNYGGWNWGNGYVPSVGSYWNGAPGRPGPAW